MPHLINLSRAARLVGASRATLQAKIRSGELASTDGMVAADELLRLYPDARLEVDGAFERVTEIKERAFGRRVRERTLPSQELLAQRLFEQSRELADTRAHLQKYHRLVVDLLDRLGAMANGAGEPARVSPEELRAWLEQGLAAVLGARDAPNSIEIMDGMLRVMSSHVVLRPSGHEYFVEGADTLLEGALHAGLALSYGCSNGVCGLCKVRVAAGEVRRVRAHDYVLTEAEKQAGYALACSYAPITDLVVEALEASGPDDIAQQQIVARVKAVEPLADDVMLVHVQTPRTNRLRFLAGQSVLLGFHPAGTAEFPVASCPCEDRNLQFHIARDPDSSFAEHVFAGTLGRGDPVSVWGPWGEFILREDGARALAFIACDTGFAPVKSLIEHALALEHAERISLVRVATRPGGHYLGNLCRSWSGALDGFRYTPIDGAGCSVQRQADTACDAIEAERPQPGAIEALDALEVYAAGPEDFVEAATQRLLARGVPAARIRTTIA